MRADDRKRARDRLDRSQLLRRALQRHGTTETVPKAGGRLTLVLRREVRLLDVLGVVNARDMLAEVRAVAAGQSA